MFLHLGSQSIWGLLLIMERAIATHSSTLAWRVPWTEEPGGLQSMGSLRVGHDWATSLSFFTFMHWRNGYPLQCSCLENPRDGGAWWAAVCEVAQSRTQLKWLSSMVLENGISFFYFILSLAAQFSQHTYWRDCLFSTVYSCLLCCRLNVRAWVYLWALHSVPFIYLPVFVPVEYSLLYLCSNYGTVWSQWVWFLQLNYSFSRSFWLLGVFYVSIQIFKLFVLVLWKMPLVFC